jgi:hypothetical protein
MSSLAIAENNVKNLFRRIRENGSVNDKLRDTPDRLLDAAMANYSRSGAAVF